MKSLKHTLVCMFYIFHTYFKGQKEAYIKETNYTLKTIYYVFIPFVGVP